MKTQPISYTVTVKFTNREDMIYTCNIKLDAQTFKRYYPKGRKLPLSGSVVASSTITENYTK
jgi:hypothetical protein